MKRLFPLAFLACSSNTYLDGIERHVCLEGSSSSDSSLDSSSDSSSSGSLAICPALHDGRNTLCLPSGVCRDALLVNASAADGTGPLALHWHGTYEWPEGILSWDSAAQAVRDMVIRERGMMVLPYADPAAPARPNNPSPWWSVCGDVAGGPCDVPDDFDLMQMVVDCSLEQDLVHPDRLTTSGMSAGGLIVSQIVDQYDLFAGAVVWSGGLQPWYQPTTPAGRTSVLGLHGGADDVYCGAGVSACYGFEQPTTEIVRAVIASGSFGVLCDHQAGHAAAMGPTGAEFLAQSRSYGHGWAGYPFGYPGTGFDWMLNNYCYPADGPSPWAD